MSNEIVVYTDGACSGNPGPGGWAYRIEWPDGRIEEGSGGESLTTNNRQELIAVREALRVIHGNEHSSGVPILIRTDSQGVINWLTRQWKRNANLDLFPTIDPLVTGLVRFEYVRGHAGNPGNERVDTLAVAAARALQDARPSS
ncbi:MAG: ribonuclease H family protein [Candidatus Dormibacteria bacterium]